DPGREYASANASKDANPSATADLISPQAGDYIVQVYNYVPNPETVVTFTLSVAGIPFARPVTVPAPVVVAPAPAAPAVVAPPAAPVVVPAPAAAPPAPVAAAPGAPIDNSAPERAAPIQGSITGALPGRNGGNFLYYKLTYPGDGRTITISLSAGPNDQA